MKRLILGDTNYPQSVIERRERMNRNPYAHKPKSSQGKPTASTKKPRTAHNLESSSNQKQTREQNSLSDQKNNPRLDLVRTGNHHSHITATIITNNSSSWT